MGYSKRIFSKQDINKFKRDTNQFITKTKGNTISALDKALDILFAMSDEIVPYDTGDTYRSKWRERISVGNKIGVDFGYDREKQIPYIGLIYLGVYSDGTDIHFRNGKVARWLERAYEIEKGRINKTIEDGVKNTK